MSRCAEQPVDAGTGGVGRLPHTGQVEQRRQRVGRAGAGGGSGGAGTDGDGHGGRRYEPHRAAPTAALSYAPVRHAVPPRNPPASPCCSSATDRASGTPPDACRARPPACRSPISGTSRPPLPPANSPGSGPARSSPAICTGRCRRPSTAHGRPAFRSPPLPALREQGYGVLEGRPSRELWDVVDWTIRTGRPRAARAWPSCTAGSPPTWRSCGRRPPAEVVALVTHGDTIRAAQAVAAGQGPDRMPAETPHNGTVTPLVLP